MAGAQRWNRHNLKIRHRFTINFCTKDDKDDPSMALSKNSGSFWKWMEMGNGINLDDQLDNSGDFWWIIWLRMPCASCPGPLGPLGQRRGQENIPEIF
jgi:hypothetical protein